MSKRVWWKNHKKYVIPAVVLLVILMFVFGTKIWLWINFLLGNDVLITLTTDAENLYLENGQTQTVSFDVKVQTNPFCQAKCASLFEDISHNQEKDRLTFTIRPGSPFHREYALTPKERGNGKELYQFSISCHSQKTVWCHTSEENITRSLLITLSHDLSQEERDTRDQLKIEIGQNFIRQSELEQEFIAYTQISNRISQVLTIETEFPGTSINQSLDLNRELFNQMKQLWAVQDLTQVQTLLTQMENNFQSISLRLDKWNQTLTPLLQQYNLAKEEIEEAQQVVESLQEHTQLLNADFIIALNQTKVTYLHKQELFNQKGTLGEKQQLALELDNYAQSLNKSVQEELLKEALNLDIPLNLDQEVLCSVSGVCVSHLGVSDYVQFSPSLNSSCKRVQDFSLLLAQTKESLSRGNLGYTNNTQFRQEIKQLTDTLQSEQAKKWITNLSTLSIDNNSRVILAVLKGLVIENSTVKRIDSSLTLAIVEELIKQQPNCVYYSLNLNLDRLPLVNIFINESIKLDSVTINLEEPAPKCPIFNEEKECCLNTTCQNDSRYYPIIFIHGHAFNKEVSTEYSLDAFNQIQNQLVEAGYINAGAISGYSFKTDTKGMWKQIPAPFAFKGSYYYDFFQESNQYSLVQTKSENIDTYAIRLKDMVDWIKYKTGRSKVVIVAHSMGGLVARRYIQVFGSESVSKLLLIGTPNYGVTTEISNYCPVIGEQLECRDLSENSLFLNKLNREALPSIPIYNIVGTGCSLSGKDSDGIVLKEKAELPGVNNYYVNGSCSGTNLLHTEMLNVNSYPKVYQIIKTALSGY